MRHICLYIGVKIFSAYVRAGPPEVVQEALADLKSKTIECVEYRGATAATVTGNMSSFVQFVNKKSGNVEAMVNSTNLRVLPIITSSTTSYF